MNAKKMSIEQEVTQAILARLKELQDDPKKWVKPWEGMFTRGLPLRSNGKPFTGINVLLLGMAGYTDPRWYTFNQAKEALGYVKNPAWKGRKSTFKGIPKFLWKGEGEDPRFGVRKGEKGSLAVRVSRVDIYEDTSGKRVYPPKGDKTGWKARLASGDVTRKASFFRTRCYKVFNAEQIDGLPPMVDPDSIEQVDPAEKYAEAEAIIAATGAKIIHVAGSDVACYRPGQDGISLPEPGQFRSVEDYMSTKFHEVVHWTGHQSRLNRDMSGTHGSPEYAFEELVAELGSAFLCAHLGIEGTLQHPEYLSAWVKRLGEDEKAILRAASLAQKATDFILDGSGDEDEGGEE